MTTHKHLKQLVRERMARTGERYAAARRHVVAAAADRYGPSVDGFLHPGGVHGDTVALRSLLANAGVALSEEMVFGVAGGIGIGVMAFHYDREDFSNFHLAGRHRWHDQLGWVTAACDRLGVAARVTESAGRVTAARQLGELLDAGVPAMAWVDRAELGLRGLPAQRAGSSYDVVVVYRFDPASGSAVVGDAYGLSEIPAERLALARARIRRDRNRLLALETPEREPDLGAAVRAGVRACAEGLLKGRLRAFTLDALGTWADRLHGSRAKDAWSRVFPPGHHLWGALRNVYDLIECEGTGGGLLRPLFARFLAEVGHDRLSARYAGLGARWSDLARAALPAEVPAFAETRALLDAKARPGAATAERSAAWDRLDALLHEPFPLTPAEADELLASLQRRVRELEAEERAACQALAAGWD